MTIDKWRMIQDVKGGDLVIDYLLLSNDYCFGVNPR